MQKCEQTKLLRNNKTKLLRYNREDLFSIFTRGQGEKFWTWPATDVKLGTSCSATAAVEQRCRACLSAQGTHFEQHLMLMFTFNK